MLNTSERENIMPPVSSKRAISIFGEVGHGKAAEQRDIEINAAARKHGKLDTGNEIGVNRKAAGDGKDKSEAIDKAAGKTKTLARSNTNGNNSSTIRRESR